MAAINRDLDVVVFGATGDTGIVGCCFLYFNAVKLGITSWAPAARNMSKLSKVLLERLEGIEAGPNGILPSRSIQADSDDYESLLKMCARAKCVISCAGPFARYGEGVVRACIEAKTNYVDITGEIDWVEKMQFKYGTQAEHNSVSIVSCAGYDSIPPDLTTFLAAKAVSSCKGDRLRRYEAYIGGGGGAMPTGTIETVLDMVDLGKRRFLNTVSFGLLGKGARIQRPGSFDAPDSREHVAPDIKYVPSEENSICLRNLIWSLLPGFSTLRPSFCVPHFMAPVNVKVVHHTAAREGYGGIEYRERLATPRGILSLYGLIPVLISVAVWALLCILAPLPYFSNIVRWLRDKLNAEPRRNVRKHVFDHYKKTGKTVVSGFGVSQQGARVNVTMQSDYDPGLGFTMLSACTIASELAKRTGTATAAKPGCVSAVVALGGTSLASALRAQGVKIQADMQGPSSGSKL